MRACFLFRPILAGDSDGDAGVGISDRQAVGIQAEANALALENFSDGVGDVVVVPADDPVLHLNHGHRTAEATA